MNSYRSERSKFDPVPQQSARGLAQSKTLLRGLERRRSRQRLGVSTLRSIATEDGSRPSQTLKSLDLLKEPSQMHPHQTENQRFHRFEEGDRRDACPTRRVTHPPWRSIASFRLKAEHQTDFSGNRIGISHPIPWGFLVTDQSILHAAGQGFLDERSEDWEKFSPANIPVYRVGSAVSIRARNRHQP